MLLHPPIEELRKGLRYVPDTGQILRQPDDTPIFTTPRAKDDPTLIGRFNGVRLRATHIAWALHYGEWPNGNIICYNGDKSDLRITNLRLVERGKPNYSKAIMQRHQMRIDNNHKRRIDNAMGNPDAVSQAFADTICEQFKYDPLTGHVTNRVTGQRAFCSLYNKDDPSKQRLRGKYRGKLYTTKHIVWVLRHGKFPDGDIYFKDGNKQNTRIENLRLIPAPKVRHDLASCRTDVQHEFDIKHLARVREAQTDDELELAVISSLCEQFEYDPETGHIINRVTGARSFCSAGPRDILRGRYRGKAYTAKRVVWALCHNEFPEMDIYHKDGDKLNTRIENLELRPPNRPSNT